ncbi:MAG: transcription termination factor NusA [bacterium]
MGTALLDATEQLEREKGIPKSVVIRSLCDAMVTAYKKHIKSQDITNVEARVNEANGEIGVFRIKTVVENVEDELSEITLKDAKKIDPDAELESTVQIEVTPVDFGRIAAQAAKQVIVQRIREAERKIILEEFLEKKGTLTTGIIQRRESRNVIISIGKIEAVLPSKEQIPGEYYRINDRIRVYVLNVKETTRLPQVIVSQIHPKIVQELFELEVPEIEDGIVEIVSISREAGYRTKIAVLSNDPEIDPVGACIGPRGSRIQTIVNELKNEKIDIIRYSDDPAEYLINALSPARIISVDILDDSQENQEALVIVPDDQLSLAIGKEGQNVRLAHRLTGWRIDIKSYSQAEAEMEEYNEENEENQEQQEQYEESD